MIYFKKIIKLINVIFIIIVKDFKLCLNNNNFLLKKNII